MKGAVSPLNLLRPRDLAEALRMLRDEKGLTPLAGCTDLYVLLNFGTLQGTRFIDLWPLDELRIIALRGDGTLVIGALVTYTQIRNSDEVARTLPILAQAAREIGGVQIQNRGTLGGNIANASPAGDTLPILAATEAVVVLRSAKGERRVPYTQFQTGYRATVRKPDELITRVEVPRVQGRQWYRKVGTRAAQAISKVVMAGVRGDATRVAVGSVAPTIVRPARAEALLAKGDVDAAVAALDSDIAPIDDIRSTEAYRRRVAGNLLRRFWQETA